MLLRLHGSAVTLTQDENAALPEGTLAIACTSAVSCVGAGRHGAAQITDEPGAPFSARWDGTKWIVKDVAAKSFGARAIACTSGTFCIAVSGYETRIGKALWDGDSSYVWNGKTWKKVTTPWPPSKKRSYFDSGYLMSVSCVSGTWCLASGFAKHHGEIEQWNGKKWVSTSAGSPALTSTGSLFDVQCFSKKKCLSLGMDHSGDAVMVKWNGKKWSRVGAAATKALGAGSFSFGDLACATAKDCYLTTSQFNEKSGQNRYYLFHWNGTKWASVAAPQGKKDSLADVECLSAGHCLVIGFKGSDRATGKAIVAATFPVTVTAG